jgi:hypothetical protein
MPHMLYIVSLTLYCLLYFKNSQYMTLNKFEKNLTDHWYPLIDALNCINFILCISLTLQMKIIVIQRYATCSLFRLRRLHTYEKISSSFFPLANAVVFLVTSGRLVAARAAAGTVRNHAISGGAARRKGPRAHK